MRTKLIILICFSFLYGQSQVSITDKANEFLKTINSLNLSKLKVEQYETLISQTSEFTFTNDSINPVLLSKIFKVRGDLRLGQFQKKLKLIYTYTQQEIEDAENSYARASELDPSVKCSCLKKLEKLYSLDLFGVDNPNEKMRDTKRQIKENC